MASDAPEPSAVPLADLEVARRIAEGARGDRQADRTPTLEQVLAAFGEPRPTPEARRRAAAALAMAGVGVSPGLEAAPAGSRVTLDASAAAVGGGGGGRGRRLLLGLGALLAIGAIIAAVVLLSPGKDGGDRVADRLPAGATGATRPTGPTGTQTDEQPTATVTGPSGTQTDRTTTVGTTPSAAAPRKAAEQRRARERAKARAERRAKERAAARRRAAERRAAARRRVTVRLIPSPSTYLCVRDGEGKTLFGGTLSAPQTFTAAVIRVNLGLASTQVLVDGKPYAVSGSPTGFEARKGGTVVPLPLGQRPEC